MHGLSKWCVILIWMVSFTVVTGQDCTISNFKNGSLSDSNFDTIGMEETYSDGKQMIVPCKLGFTGFFKIKCSGGHWTKVFGAICTPKSCGHPGESLNADFALVSGTDFVFTSVVQYKCHEGYIMVSRNPNRVCLDQGWSGNTPTCESIKCPEITVGEHVLVTGNRLQSSYGNVLQFSCRNKLLALYGPLHIRCEGNGQWNEEPPKCDVVKCKVPDIANGIEDITEYGEGQYLTFACQSGYSPSSRRPQCVNIRKRAGWSQTPLCERVTCQLLQVRGSTYPGVNKDRFLLGETVSVKCNQGYWFSFSDQRSQKTINCTESGEWDTGAMCQEIRCLHPNDPNLKTRLSSKWLGDYSQYQCNEGFTQTTGWARCTENGWTPKPLCEVNPPCKSPTRVENAVIIEKKREVYNSGAEVTYACRTNYRMEGQRTIRCQRGQWSPGIPTCNRVTCPLGRERGTTYPDVHTDRFLLGETVSVKCNQGYWFSFFDQRSQKTIHCTESGEWDTAPTCQEIRCLHPNDPNLKTRLPFTWMGHHAEYQCKEGFTQTTIWARCTENGWTPNPLCEAEPKEVEAAVGPGSSATTTAGVTCPLLRVKGTIYVDVNKYRFLPGETVLVKCSGDRWFSFFDQRSQKTIHCTESGEWDTAPTCQDKKCQDSNDPNLKKKIPSRRMGTTAPYGCNDGFTPTYSLATCTENGWTPNPLCEEDSSHQRTCGPPPLLPDGDIVSDLNSPYQHGETVRYTCQLKFTIKGEVKTCENGQWTGETTCLINGAELENTEKVEPTVVSGSSATTTAEDSSRQRTCGPPPPLPDGDIVSDLKSPYQHGETVRYTCQFKFTIKGEVKTCENGQWTGETTCLRPCTVGRLQLQPHHLKFLRDGVEELDCAHNDTLTFVCEEGFEHIPKRISRVCVNGGMDLPTCLPEIKQVH